MATKSEKEELLQTLKFTPRTVKVQIWGYGGENYIGSVSREDYEFFKAKKIDIEQYANGWDEDKWTDVPQERRIFEPGSPYECDNLFHESGATMDSSSRIQVEDEDGKVIWESTLDITELEEAGVQTVCDQDFESADLEDGTVLFWGGQGEKGSFFNGEFVLRAPFDPSKLTVHWSNGDDWHLSGSVEYNGEDIENTDYSTTGKWGEHKFWIVGDEEVYTGVERDDDWDPAEELDKIEVPVLENEETWASKVIDESMLSSWHGADLKPAHKGEYEVVYDAEWPNSGQGRAEWTGRGWKQNGKKLAIKQWRGLNQPA